jgi:YD repeat-containing protein
VETGGRPKSFTVPYDGETKYTWNIAYDDPNRGRAITDPSGKLWVETYDELGRLVSRKDPLNNETTFGYNGLGKLSWMRHPDGRDRHWTYSCRDPQTIIVECRIGIEVFAFLLL